MIVSPSADVNGARSTILQELAVPQVPLERCNKHPEFMKLGKTMTSPHLCAGGEVGKDSCNGDSGGPLVKADRDDGAFYQIGIVSFGASLCGGSDMPAVYARVAEFLPWILETVRA